MLGKGKGSAPSVAARLKLALIVGICGGVLLRRDGEEMLLGDDVITSRIVPYDFGRQCQEQWASYEHVSR
jgi:hypothetical protein